MSIENIKLIAHRNIAKGEEFTLADALSVNKNKIELDNLIKEQSDQQVEILLNNERIKLQNDFEQRLKLGQEKLELANERTELNIKNEANDKIAEIKLAYQTTQISLKEKEDKLETLKGYFDALKESYENKMRLEVEKEVSLKQKEFDLEKSSLNDQIKNLSEIKTANKIGEEGEQEIKETLSNFFTSDNIKDTIAQQNEADVVQEVIDQSNGNKIGTIYYEVKNRDNWSLTEYKKFTNKINEEGKIHDLNIFIGKVLPSKEPKDQRWDKINDSFYYDKLNNVFICSFNNWLSLTYVLRAKMIEFKNLEGKIENISSIHNMVYKYVTGAEFRGLISAIDEKLNETKEVFTRIKKEIVKGETYLNKAQINLGEINSKITSFS